MNLRYIRTKLVKFTEGIKKSKKENRIIVKKNWWLCLFKFGRDYRIFKDLQD